MNWMKLWGEYRREGMRLDYGTFIQLLKEMGDIKEAKA